MDRKERLLAAGERALRTAVQAGFAAALPILYVDGAAWSDVPRAASIGAFAALLSFASYFAGPLAPRR